MVSLGRRHVVIVSMSAINSCSTQWTTHSTGSARSPVFNRQPIDPLLELPKFADVQNQNAPSCLGVAVLHFGYSVLSPESNCPPISVILPHSEPLVDVVAER